MIISTIDNSQRTAARVAGFSCLFSMAIVVFANYGLLNPLVVPGPLCASKVLFMMRFAARLMKQKLESGRICAYQIKELIWTKLTRN